MKIKTKIINHFVMNGEKKTSEKILLKSLKELQKFSKKQSKILIQLALVYTTPVFRTYKKISKNRKKLIKEFPIIVINKKTRVSLAIKFILIAALENKKMNDCYIKLYKSILCV